MTFPEDIEATMITDAERMTFGTALKQVVQNAAESRRLTAGVFECAQHLNNNPDNVAMCILPMGTDDEDVTNHIQHTLVEAFCWENDIPLIKVDSAKKLAAIIEQTDLSCTDNHVSAMDYGCVLIQHPKVDNEADTAMTMFYNNVLPDDHLIIEIPV